MGATKEYMQGYRAGNTIKENIEVRLDKKYWHKVVKKFEKEWQAYGLNKIQSEILSQACTQLQLIEECKRILEEKGLCYVTVTGTQRINPVTKVLKDATTSFTQLLRLLSESLKEEGEGNE